MLFLGMACSEGNEKPGYIETGKSSETNDSDTTLVFRSGFEGNTRIVQRGTSTDDDIIGFDPDLEASNWNDLKRDKISIVFFNYTGGDASKRYAKIIDDPTKEGNKVLHFWLNDYWLASEEQEKGRIQIEFHDIKGGYKEFFQTVRVYLCDDFNTLKKYSKGFNWLTLSEFWNNESWSQDYGFRISLGIGKDSGADKELYFMVTAENEGFQGIWSVADKNLKVPIGKWFTMYYHFKEGNKETGRFHMTVTPDGEAEQTICDVRDFTHNTTDPSPNGLTAYNPLKLYTSKEVISYMKSQGKTLQIYWDDLRLWKIQASK
jgi:hypothetical protein